MSKPIVEPSTGRAVATNRWGIDQLFRRPLQPGRPAPNNDDLPNADALLPLYDPDTGLFTWKNQITGTTVGATLDSDYDPVFFDDYNTTYADYNSSVWYQILLPRFWDDTTWFLWASCDFGCRVIIYNPDQVTMSNVEQAAGSPIIPQATIWPTTAAHLCGLLMGTMGTPISQSCSTVNGSNVLTVNAATGPNKTWAVGWGVVVAGAGVAGADLFTRITAISDAGNTITVANNCSTTIGSIGIGTTVEQIIGNPFADWTSTGVNLAAGTNGEAAWVAEDTGGEGYVGTVDSMPGTPVYVEVVGRAGAEGAFILYWSIPQVTDGGDDTSETLFEVF